MSPKRLLGIDFGTTKSCISYVRENGKAIQIPIREYFVRNDLLSNEQHIIPSVLRVDKPASKPVIENRRRELDRDQFGEIVDLLSPLMQTESERRAILNGTFPDNSQLIRDVRLEGEVSSFVPNLIRKLIDYGGTALSDLLSVCKDKVGSEKQARLDTLVSNLDTPERIETTRHIVEFPLTIEVGVSPRRSERPCHTFRHFKRFVGESLNHKHEPEYRLGETREGENYREYIVEPVGLAGRLLYEMRKAMRYIENQREIDDRGDTSSVTITVPARSSTSQRMATRFAAKLAGFGTSGEIYVLEEPIAVFLYHYYDEAEDNDFQKSGNALVFDFGGGTCDLSVIEYSTSRLPAVRARQMGEFGGEDIDELIVRRWFDENSNIDISYTVIKEQYPSVFYELLVQARSLKEALAKTSVGVSVEKDGRKLIDKVLGEKFSCKLDRKGLREVLDKEIDRKINGEWITGSIIEFISKLIENVIISAELRADINLILLAGGSSHLFDVQKLIREKFGKTTIVARDMEFSIAGGAAKHQFYRQSKNKSFRDLIKPTLPYDIEIAVGDQMVSLASAGDTLPIDSRFPFSKGFKWLRLPKDIRGKTQLRLYIKDHQGIERGEPFTFEIDIPRSATEIIIKCDVDDYGIIEMLKCVLINPWSIRGVLKTDKQEQQIDLLENFKGFEDYSVRNSDRIRQLSYEYGINSWR